VEGLDFVQEGVAFQVDRLDVAYLVHQAVPKIEVRENSDKVTTAAIARAKSIQYVANSP